MTADDWQEDILADWLQRRPDGRWAASVCWLSAPRQNGKNACIEIRELYGMVELGEQFLHSAHEVKTARKAFRRLLSFFESPRYPELASMVTTIRKTNGQEAIFLSNGGSVELIARSSGSGRGFAGIDVLVCDEAQDLSDDEQAALLPTISAATRRNPQVIYTGTPPDPLKRTHGMVFRRVRAQGVAGVTPRLCVTDFGVGEGPLPDVDDRDVWHGVNPALGDRLDLEEVERERGLMTPEKFAAERLGWWGDPAVLVEAAVVDFAVWGELADKDAEAPAGSVALAVDVPPDRSRTSIAAAWRAGERLWVMVVSLPGTSQAVGKVAELVVEHKVVDVSLHAGGPAGALLGPLEEAGVTVRSVSTMEAGQATGGFLDLVAARALGHLDQPELNAALTAARLRNVGDAVLWDRKDLTDISSLFAVSLAANGHIRYAPDDYDVLDSLF